MIRLLMVEDSKTVQKALMAAFNTAPEIQVVGTAESGEAAVSAACRLRPDLITMDINLPGMNGLEATRAIMSSCPVPIVVVTGKMDPKDSAALFCVMEAGALMVLAKPAPVGTPDHAASVAHLVRNIKLMSEIKVVRRLFPPLVAARLSPLIPPSRGMARPSGWSLSAPRQGVRRSCNRS